MAILQEIALQNVPNQSLTVNINNQTLNITIRTIAVNNKSLQNQTPSYQSSDMLLGGELIKASSLFTMVDVQLGNTPIVYNAYANNAQYINLFPSTMVGYLFFYKNDWATDDKIIYTNFYNGSTTHLYYVDYDALKTDFYSYVAENKTSLQMRYLYGIR